MQLNNFRTRSRYNYQEITTKLSLDLNSHRSNSTNRAGLGLGFHHDRVPLAGLGTVEVDGVQYKNVTERDFCHEDGNNGFLGSGTSGTVFKKKFKNKNVAVKQIAKSDDKDEMKVRKSQMCLVITKLSIIASANGPGRDDEIKL